MEITDIRYRNDLPAFLNENNLLGVGVEVGVLSGHHSKNILRKWTGKLLYSVDSWIRPSDIKRYAQTKQNLQVYKDRSVILKMTSLKASNVIEDNSLDFCYIDASHTYAEVFQDCKLWWKKIKTGGVLCGHDYSWTFTTVKKYGIKLIVPSRIVWHPGVKQAVDKFVIDNKLKVHIDKYDEWPLRWRGKPTSWYILKNA